MKEIKTPLRYPGGKSRLSNKLVELFPEFDEYREPFLGGGSVFLAALQKFHNKKYFVNDIFPELATFWDCLIVDDKKLIQSINKFLQIYGNDGKGLFHFCKNINSEDFPWDDIAAAFFILNRVTFSGTTLSGGYSEQAFKTRLTYSSIKRLSDVHNLLKNVSVSVTNEDYKVLLNKKNIDDRKEVFIYCDPPYYSATKSRLYGKKGDLHTGFNHEEFAENMRNCKYKWMISYDDCPYIRDLFSFANIQTVEQTYGMKNVAKDKENNKQKVNELIIRNY